MHRQKSILSFLKKPSPDDRNIAGDAVNDKRTPHIVENQKRQDAAIPVLSTMDSSAQVRGTDTPPEKVPRQIFAANLTASGGEHNSGPSLFSSIMHKFVKVDTRENTSNRNKANDDHHTVSSTSNGSGYPKALPARTAASGLRCKETVLSTNAKTADEEDKGHPLLVENDDDILGPETPGTRPVVPRLKRVQDDTSNSIAKSDFSLQNSSKRVKFLEPVVPCLKRVQEDTSNSIAKNDFLLQNSSRRVKFLEPVVPCLKRVQEVTGNSIAKSDFSLQNSSKRVKFLEDPVTKNKKNKELYEMTSKFEWLDPSNIKDANGRRPSNPLYDKSTLYIPPDALKKMSASQKQYWSVKSQYMDVLLFFKVGKFYELYEVDAEIGHKELDWKITLSGVGKCRQVGISESGIDDAVQKLVVHGYKVGRIEQLETSDQAKARGGASVIQRKLVHVVTPSTNMDVNIGPEAVHLLSIKEGNCVLDNGSTAYGFAFVDCAALKFWVGSFSDDTSCAALGTLLMQVSPKEILYESQGLSREGQKALKNYSLTSSLASQLTPVQTSTTFVDQSEVRNLIQSKGYFKGFCNNLDRTFDGIMHRDLSFCALGGLVTYLSRLMLDDAIRNGDIIPYQLYRGCLRMDGQTLVNLEIFSNSADGSSSGTLYNYLDKCITSSGKRLLRHWICHPLNDTQEISCRLNVVEEMMAHSDITLLIAQHLRKLPDLERLLGRIKATFQSSALLLFPLIGSKVLKRRVKQFGSLIQGLRVGLDLLKLLQKGVHTMSSFPKLKEIPELGGSDGLDKFLSQFEAAIDSDYPNYQDHDAKESDAEVLSILIELFIEKSTEWSQVIHAINCIDVLRSFAVISKFSSGAMCRPIILPHSKSKSASQESRGPTLKLKGLWHPFALSENGGLPVPNDIHLGEDTDRYRPCTLLLTGPNMGGKSTLLRATCIAVILAQLGCYVPCEMCVLSLVDIIFTRLGASDRIMTGESTFFIECKETASVLQNATQDSLVLLDELGRGTSTFDGYAIAYAVFRHLIEKVNCRLLFATHYHPLTKEFASHPHVMLQHMAFTFKPKSDISAQGDNELVFLYRLTNGACPESYGMQVALNAGVPKLVVEAASNAGQVMKRMVGESFKASEWRSEFSTLHEQWLKTLITVTEADACTFDEDDVFDTLFCLWHELKSSTKNMMT